MSSKPTPSFVQAIESSALIEPLLVGRRQAAKLLGIGERLLWDMTKVGQIPHIKAGSRVLYSVKTLRDWIADQEITGSNAKHRKPL